MLKLHSSLPSKMQFPLHNPYFWPDKLNHSEPHSIKPPWFIKHALWTNALSTVTNLQQSYRHFIGKKILAWTSLFHSSAEAPHQEQAVPDVMFFNILCWVKKSRTLQHWATIHKLEASYLSNLNHEHLNILQFHLAMYISLSQIYQFSYPHILILSLWASCFQISASYTIL